MVCFVTFIICYLPRNLDETTKSVYKENVRINRALHYYMEEVEQLKRWRKRLEKENSQLKATKELDEALIRRKVTQSRHNKSLIKEVWVYKQ